MSGRISLLGATAQLMTGCLARVLTPREPEPATAVERSVRANRSTLWLTLLISIALHAALFSVALGAERAGGDAAVGTRAELPDRWFGDSVDVELMDSKTALPEPAIPVPARAEPRPDPQPIAPPTKPELAVRPSSPAPDVQSRRAPSAASALKERAGGATAPPGGAPEPVERAVPPSADAASPSGLASSTASGEAASRTAGATFGAVGPEGAVRQLGRAFTRALPAAALPKDGWLALPVGVGSSVRVTLTLDESGQLLAPEFGQEPVPRALAELVRRAHLLLQRGRFAIGEESGAGSETFSLHLEVTDEPTDDPFAEPGYIMRRGFESPEPDRPGRADFTFASGRHVVIHVAIVPERVIR